MDTQEKVFAYIREHHMLQAGDRVVAGVSGGADSVCLLFLLLEWQKEVPTDIAVVHVDHGIRAEAGEDARYVEQLCEERGIPFFLTRAVTTIYGINGFGTRSFPSGVTFLLQNCTAASNVNADNIWIRNHNRFPCQAQPANAHTENA